jgi:hypothetical protein
VKTALVTELKFEVAEVGLPPRRAPRPRGPRRKPRKPTTFLLLPCPNCDERFKAPGHTSRAYCGQPCGAEANAVRYARKRFADYPDGDLPDDIDYAIRIQLAHAVASGYPRAERLLPPEVRAAVFERDAGLCVICGEPGEDIDHINGSSPDLGNLRLLCKDCHREVTEKHLVPATGPELEKFAELHARIEAPEPLRPCDAVDWARCWRKWRKDHAVAA